MEIYALRDRLIDYFLPPFTTNGVEEALAAAANTVNLGDATSAITQAPHHFELWQIGTLDKAGHLAPKREFIADCSSLVRGNLRQERKAAGNPLEGPKNERTAPPGGDRGSPGTTPAPSGT